MEYYIFKVSTTNNIEIKTYNIVKGDDEKYIKYNNFLKNLYFTDIDTNDDFIPMINNNEIIMILRKEQFSVIDLEDIFEILTDNIRRVV